MVIQATWSFTSNRMSVYLRARAVATVGLALPDFFALVTLVALVPLVAIASVSPVMGG